MVSQRRCGQNNLSKRRFVTRQVLVDRLCEEFQCYRRHDHACGHDGFGIARQEPRKVHYKFRRGVGDAQVAVGAETLGQLDAFDLGDRRVSLAREQHGGARQIGAEGDLVLSRALLTEDEVPADQAPKKKREE